MLIDVVLVLDELVLDCLFQVVALGSQVREPVDHVLDQVKSIEAVLYPHVERGRDRALFVVPADMKVGVGAPVGEPVDQPWVAVEREDDVLVSREQRVVVLVAQAVRMLAAGLQSHQVDDVDDADPQLRQMLAQDRDSGEDLERRRVPAARHHHVGLAALVVAGPGPDADAFGAMDDRLLHGQPLRQGVLAGDHDVDVVPAAQAVVEDREQAVGVGREIDANDVGLLVDDVVDEAGILVRETVVILLPDVGGEQIVQRRDLPAAVPMSPSATWRAG